LRIAYGPVQPFIAASRKTRDLKAGSDLLVDLGKEIVASLPSDTEFVFPAERHMETANIVLVYVSEDPATIAHRAKLAAERFLVTEFDALRLDPWVDVAMAHNQLHRFLEFYAAWVPESDYIKDVQAVSRLLTARKGLREFGPAPSYPGIVKSSLLPEYECVVKLDASNSVPKTTQSRLGIGKRETLDAVSLMKRLRGRATFPSTREIAVRHLLASGLADDTVAKIKLILADTPYEIGDAIFDVFDDLPDPNDRPLSVESRQKVRGLVGEVLKRNGFKEGQKPSPYYAILHGDGDSMGKFLRGLATKDSQRAFSQVLSTEFSAKVGGIVERSHGVTVFAGGDDVLALLPAPTALNCAQQIRDLFEKVLTDFSKLQSLNFSPPTLTIGIAFCH
jgi:CRISPR-associated protein Cmr2